jgi:hypothetical protein
VTKVLLLPAASNEFCIYVASNSNFVNICTLIMEAVVRMKHVNISLIGVVKILCFVVPSLQTIFFLCTVQNLSLCNCETWILFK